MVLIGRSSTMNCRLLTIVYQSIAFIVYHRASHSWLPCVASHLFGYFFCDVFPAHFLSVSPPRRRCRPPACDLLWVGLLVLHLLLRVEPEGGRDLPRLPALPHRGRLHGPLQLGALLPGSALQRQPQLRRGAHAQTHRWAIWCSGRPLTSIRHLDLHLTYTAGLNYLPNSLSLSISLQDAGWGYTTSAGRCLQSVSVTAPSLSRVQTATSATAGILPPSARSLQVGMGVTALHRSVTQERYTGALHRSVTQERYTGALHVNVTDERHRLCYKCYTRVLLTSVTHKGPWCVIL